MPEVEREGLDAFEIIGEERRGVLERRPASSVIVEVVRKNEQSADGAPAPRKRWAWLLRHVFQADLDSCPRCDGPMRWVEAAASKDAARDLLARLGLRPRPPPVAPTTPLGQLKLPLGR